MKRFTERFEKHGIWWRKYTVLHELIREFVRGTFLEISLGAIPRGFESLPLRHIAADDISFAATFLQKSPLTHFVAAPFQTGPAIAGLRFGSAAVRRFFLVTRRYRFWIDGTVVGGSPDRPSGRRRFCAVQAFSSLAKTLAQGRLCRPRASKY